MRDELDAVIEELKAMVSTARTMPMSSSVVINRNDLLDVVDRVEKEIANTIDHAAVVVEQRDEVIEQGQTEAENIVQQAHEEREELLSDTGIFRLAEGRAYELTKTAEEEAALLRREADEYVEQRLADFELTLERTLEAVKRGRDKLLGGDHHGLADDSDVDDMDLPDHLA